MIRGGLLAMGRHNYQVKIAELVRCGKVPSDGCVHVHVEHDLWCDVKLVGGLCNCDPRLCVREIPEVTDG